MCTYIYIYIYIYMFLKCSFNRRLYKGMKKAFSKFTPIASRLIIRDSNMCFNMWKVNKIICLSHQLVFLILLIDSPTACKNYPLTCPKSNYAIISTMLSFAKNSRCNVQAYLRTVHICQCSKSVSLGINFFNRNIVVIYRLLTLSLDISRSVKTPNLL